MDALADLDVPRKYACLCCNEIKAARAHAPIRQVTGPALGPLVADVDRGHAPVEMHAGGSTRIYITPIGAQACMKLHMHTSSESASGTT